MIRALFAALLLCASIDVAACPLCLGAFASSPAQQLADLQQAILALPTDDGYRVVAVIKGATPAAGVIDVAAVQLKSGSGPARKPLLLARDAAWPLWVSLGTIGSEHADWLRQIAGEKRRAQMDADSWRARVALMSRYLEHRESLVAEIAYAELATAPYSALRTAKSHVSALAIRRWVADPALAARQPLYLLLLGIAGDARDADAIEQRLEVASQSNHATNLGPLLAADLQLRGPKRIGWIESRYLTDPKRSTQEVEAAVLALSVHANADDALVRERVIRSYRAFIRARPDIAGLVATDLANWHYWDAVPEYVALMKSDVRQQYVSRAGIVGYLLRSPGGAQSIDLREKEIGTTASPPIPVRASSAMRTTAQ